MATEQTSAGGLGSYADSVKELNSTDPGRSGEAARRLDSWRDKMVLGLVVSLDEPCRAMMRGLADKFNALRMTELLPGRTFLHPDWIKKCHTSSYKHLVGNNTHLGEGRILEVLLADEPDRALLWKVCKLAKWGWLQELRRMTGSNRDLGMNNADFMARSNAGAPDHPIV
jgi:hypothetical protein